MQGLRSIAAIVAGFGFMASTVMVGTILASGLFLSGSQTTAAGAAAVPGSIPLMYVVANLATSLLGGLFGGWLAARIGASAPFAHALALAAVTAVLAVLSVRQAGGAAPAAWYPLAVGTASVSGVLAGGKLRAAAASPRGAVVA